MMRNLTYISILLTFSLYSQDPFVDAGPDFDFCSEDSITISQATASNFESLNWTTLENYLIANGYNYDSSTTENKIGKAMASTAGWNSSANTGAPGNDQSLNNGSGFNAFPEGSRRSYDGAFPNESNYAFFWSSTESNLDLGWYRYLSFGGSYLYRNDYDGKRSGLSVRFVRD